MLRYGDAKELLVSGLLEGAGDIAKHPAVVDVPVEKGHVVLFSNNPIYRWQNHGEFNMVLNALLNWNDMGGKPAAAAPTGAVEGRR